MRAALLPDRGVVKVAGDGARNFLHGLVTADILNLKAGEGRFCALLTPQGKIIADFIVTAAPAEKNGGFFLDVPRALGATLVEKLNLYKLRAKVVIEDRSEVLGVLAIWDGNPPPYPPPQAGEGSLLFPLPQAGESWEGGGLCYADPRLPALGTRVLLPPHLAANAAAALGADFVDASEYEAHRIALGVPRGGLDFSYGDAFPHETDMDQLAGVDFGKGCYVGQEVVSRMEHRGTARTRAVPVRYDGAAPEAGAAVVAGNRQVGIMGSAASGSGIALLRLDRVAEALARDEPLIAGGAGGGVPLRLVKPDWARFAFPGESKAAE
jgi:tRNA-modifying protein YgfZ